MGKPGIDPVRWNPPAPVTVPTTPIGDLRTYLVPGFGPEDVLIDDEGRVLTGVDDGRILRVDADGGIETLVDTGGRPLGLEWLPDSRLLICDAARGLLAVDLERPRDIEVLTDTVDGRRVRVCNNAAVAADGSIWFSDSTSRFDLEYWKADLLEHSGTGRLIRRDADGSATTVLNGLQFANGVALAPGDTHVYVAETGSYCLTSVSLGRDAGRATQVEPVLPGFPDNISTGSDGRIWIAIASPRNSLVDRLSPLHGALRKAAWALPEPLQPQPEAITCAVVLDPATDGVVAAYGTQHPSFGVSTGVRERNGTVWFGSLVGSTVAAFDVPAGSQA